MADTMRYRRGTGWLLFAAVVLWIGGIHRILDAFWAFDRDDRVGGLDALFWQDDLALWGWTWLIVGVLMVAAGFGVLSRVQWARFFGIFMGTIAAVSAALWMYVFPIWSLIAIVIGVLVVYGLAVYGGDVDESV